MNKLAAGLAACLTACAGVSPAFAGLLVDDGNIGTGSTENLLYNQTGLADNGTVVQGALNSSGLIVDLASDELLTTHPGGQADIGAHDGGFDDLTVSMNDPNGVFDHLIINLHLLDPPAIPGTQPGHAPQTLSVTATLAGGGVLTDTLLLDGHGNNFVTIRGTNGDRFASLRLETDHNFDSARQLRLGGAALVPEPASLGLLAGAALLLRRRRTA